MVGQEESLSGRQMEQSQVKSKGVSGSRCVLPCGWTGQWVCALPTAFLWLKEPVDDVLCECGVVGMGKMRF